MGNMNDDGDEIKFTPEQAAEVAELHRRRDAKMDEIVALLALELGYGSIANLTVEQRQSIEAEAEEAEERWMEDADMADPPIVSTTPLQRLLRDHHDLGELILNIQEEAMGLGEDDG